MDNQNVGAPTDRRTNPLWAMLLALLEGFRRATPAPVSVVAVRRVRRRG